MYEMENVSFEEIESSQRLQQLAVEIITFDRQAKITAVSCAIEIGERLLEAKELVAHGDWDGGSKKTSTTANLPPTTSCGCIGSMGATRGASSRPWQIRRRL